MRRLCVIIGLVLCPFLFCSAQMGKLYDVDNQLPSSIVSQVFIDNDGLLWVATRNGLCRYDGYQFRVFDKQNGEGMINNYVNCIAQDQQNRFYLGTFGGLMTFDGASFQEMKVYDREGNETHTYVICVLVCSDGDVFVGTSGNGVLHVDSPMKAHQLGGDLKTAVTIHSMVEDNAGRIWIATDRHGVLVYDKKRRKVVRRYLDDTALQSYVRRLGKDRQGNIYVGTSLQGVFRLEGNTFQHIAATGNRSVTALFCNRDNQMVVGYDGSGLSILDPATGAVVENPYFSRMVDLSQAKVVSITEDAGGNLWIGMLQKGIYMQPASRDGFHYMGVRLGKDNLIGQACVASTLIDSNGYFWVGTDRDGLYHLSPDMKLVRHYAGNVPTTILALAEDPKHNIWLGSYQEGCGWVDPAGNYHSLQLPQGNRVSVFGIQADRQGNVWFATMGNGLLRLMPDGQIRSYTVKGKAAVDRQVNSLTNDYISALSLSPDQKRVYLATTMGMCCFDIDRESFLTTFGQNCMMYGTAVITAKEYGGRLLIGTNDSLFVYDMLSHQLQNYTASQGIFDNGVATLEIDQKGRLWGASYKGLCCYDPKTGAVEKFFVDDGLQSNEFSSNASSTHPNGLMLFGGVGGITWFDPLKISQKNWEASVRVTEFLINGEPVSRSMRSGRYQVCDTSVIASDRFDLSYRDNSFTIQLSTLTYDMPEHITYVYRINNEAPVRLQPGKNEVTFSHLSPGTYRFRVSAQRNEQTTAEREFTVVIHSPWFRTWWAYCLYALAIGFAIWQYLRQRSRSEQDHLRLQEHIHAEEMGEAKVRFFMNISHEIRTPMTLILTPLQTLMKQDDDPHRRSVYETIRRNAERILSLINQLMDLRKIDKGMMQMHMSRTDLVPFVEDIYTLFDYQARAKRINFRYEHDDAELPVWIDRRQFDKVVVNILSNAFKFTPSNGEILLRVSHQEDPSQPGHGTATITVSDNGEKIPADKFQHIFKRFYQTAAISNDRNVGTGIGLDLTRSLVELHHGTVTARNIEADEAATLFSEASHSTQGVEFLVTIPLGNAHLRPDEIQEEIPLQQAPVDEVVEQEPEADDQFLSSWGDSPKSAPTTIIIAEDDDEIREYLSQELSSTYRVVACANGREALNEALRNQPALIISDIMMPEMDGNTLAATLKSNPQASHIPIILLTAKNRDEDKLEGLETGADAYIVKPFNMDILRQTIINLIQSRRQLRLKYQRNDQLESQVRKVEMKSPDEQLLDRVMKVINENLSNSDLNIDHLATTVGISRVHLHRKMKELTGQTPHDFIRNIRLKQAAHLLSNGDMNITDVMYACGFSNPASFSTIFKRYYGMTPREYKTGKTLRE